MASDVLPRLRGRLRTPRHGDAALALGLFVVVGVGSARSLLGSREESWGATAVSWLLIALSCGALYFRRRHPVTVTAVVLAACTAYYLTSTYDGPLLVVAVIALYTVAAEGRLAAAVVLGLIVIGGTGLGTLAGNEDVTGVALFMLTGWLVGIIALGRLRHNRLAYARQVERRAISDERVRIARDLHDVIGHHISLINVQSAAALRRMTRNPEAGAAQAEQALAAIKDSSREALRDLRATLGVLRQAGETAPTAPAPGLERIGELTEWARRAGLDVRVESAGERSALPAEVDLAAYRIVQESLTNVTRHARASAVVIRIDQRPGELRVEIDDDGHGFASGGVGGGGSGGGSGISGMRERARTLGGDLSTGPRPGGGFSVRARLPYPSVPVVKG
ncbi:sensor histidine kinase [Streptomyces sp. NPDC056716]|uniref:sensor histidine kinase n=1 Tax=unclassified Streptomyces TaxID=2593676 RepID=UPI0036C17C54